MATRSEAGRRRSAVRWCFNSAKRLSRLPRVFYLLREADIARQQGDYVNAAENYRRLTRLAPERRNAWIQLGNMLKDSGNFADAEAAYLTAWKRFPGFAEIQLQLGHLYKLSGRRGMALDAYRQALMIDPAFGDALRELALAGEPDAQLASLDSVLRQGALEALLSIRDRLAYIQDVVGELGATLPDALSSAAFPVESYTELRRLFDPPTPGAEIFDEAIAIVLLADGASLGDLHEQLTAIISQSYSRWTLHVLTSESAQRSAVQRAALGDARIYLCDMEIVGRPALAEWRAATRSDAPWTVLLGPAARTHPHLLSWIAAAVAMTGCEACVFDEEFSSDNGALEPELRGPLDPFSVLEAQVWGESVAIRTSMLRELGEPSGRGLRESRSQLLIALVERARVAHIPLPLIRTPAEKRVSAVERAHDHLEAVRRSTAYDRRLEVRLLPGSPVVQVQRVSEPESNSIAVIIPSSQNIDDLSIFLNSLIKNASRPDLVDLVVVNNGSAAYGEAVRALTFSAGGGFNVIDELGAFNWSYLSNRGVSACGSSYVICANDDMEMLSTGWDDTIRGLLDDCRIGAIGVRLLYPDNTIQHGGILFDWQGSAIHDGLHRHRDAPGPALRWQLTRCVSAVTGAFLAFRRQDFDMVGGFDASNLGIAYSDLDFCMKLRAAGRRIVWTPTVTAHHFESKSRGLDHLDVTRRARDASERRVMRQRWGEQLDHDPSLNPFWVQATLPHRLIMFPSIPRVWRHLTVSAKSNPWELKGAS